MKKFTYSLVAFLTLLVCSAQSSVVQAEYFWDTDPGAGLATPVLATDGNFNSAFEQLIKTGITLPSLGLHVFNIRVKDNTGVWGPTFRNVINVQNPHSSIVQAEYFWDTDPGAGLATPVLATDENFNSAFEQLTKTGIALPSLGLHVFNIRVKDNTGVWGPTFRNVINVQNTLGTPNFDLKNLLVYPNPVKNILTISFETAITSVIIYDMLGKPLLTKALNNTYATIDISTLTSGIYFVKIQVDNAFKTLKIIKE